MPDERGTIAGQERNKGGDSGSTTIEYKKQRHILNITEKEKIVITDIASELINDYWNRSASEFDIESVCKKLIPDPEDNESFEFYIDNEKYLLLEYIFECSARRGLDSWNWQYIDTVYKEFCDKGIKTVEDAAENNF